MKKKENNKKTLMILVIFFSVVIFAIWLWLFKWQINNEKNNKPASQENLLNEPEIIGGLEKIKSQFSGFAASIKGLLNQKKSTTTPALTNEQINSIKEKVQAELNNSGNLNNNQNNNN